MGITLATFIASGKIPSLIDLLKMEDNEISRAGLAIFMNLVEIPYMSDEWLDLRDLIMSLISSGVVSFKNNEHLLGSFR